MSTDLKSIGLGFDRWQDAVEAAIATNQLAVIGEIRGGQLIQFADVSGAQINILAVEPFATFAGFEAITQTFAHVSMVNDVLAFCEILDPAGNVLTSITCNLAQGPLLAEEPTQQWQQIGVTALALNTTTYDSADAYQAATGEVEGQLVSEGAQLVISGSGGAVPDAAISFSARVLEAEHRTNQLTGQRFIHAVVDGAFPFDVCLPDVSELPARDAIIAGTALLTASVLSPVSGGGCGGCGGSCGCG
ncbi:hypothetical protein [Corynebacterium alimapuense]|uniref:Uncharacterized protein n=1 Tax=Corynebacterium alimapuense TaxID=1576874 RepID=A0A3M8K9X6_9CORY|nr:hypothetical protein [Corynebacterium alimapuense]RNE49334.1 hypothetical protein C5L39_02910 [Corynebacterium alimapuense]